MAVKGQAFCDVNGCPKVATGRVAGLRVCNKHWMRWYRKGAFDDDEPPSEHGNAVERDAQALMRLGQAADGFAARFSMLFKSGGIDWARTVSRLMYREWVTVTWPSDDEDTDPLIEMTEKGRTEYTACEEVERITRLQNRMEAERLGKEYLGDEPRITDWTSRKKRYRGFKE